MKFNFDTLLTGTSQAIAAASRELTQTNQTPQVQNACAALETAALLIATLLQKIDHLENQTKPEHQPKIHPPISKLHASQPPNS